MIIAVDFDGTCVTHAYPEIGRDIGAVPVLQEMVKASHDLILFTMRSGEPLAEAILWFDEHQIPLYGVNSNPTQHEWTSSPKAYAGLYIDDAALGCPLLYEDGNRPYVNWIKARELLERRGVFSG